MLAKQQDALNLMQVAEKVEKEMFIELEAQELSEIDSLWHLIYGGGNWIIGW
ncbi:MAG: hypothetical protein ACRCU3_10690 [Eubacteriaceae bacterium]